MQIRFGFLWKKILWRSRFVSRTSGNDPGALAAKVLTPSAGQGRKVLVVDDNEINRVVLGRIAFDERIDVWTVTGCAVIIVAGIVSIRAGRGARTVLRYMPCAHKIRAATHE